MNNLAIFEKVAAKELTPEQAAEIMLAADKKARQPLRPAWAPTWAWALGLAAIGLFLALIGLERREA